MDENWQKNVKSFRILSQVAEHSGSFWRTTDGWYKLLWQSSSARNPVEFISKINF